ncbi:hypothetical protein [Pelagerythrobacter marensis]|uniref:SnoaL-like domain-containing protein n=1 Tax=Pelagerythrobacter marensis TaxID=543877 RepID=A0A0G3X8F2_9SPHN|nr:hypothetical protein [Pelagerythrobacter marensis]AKM06623.1 hypothetical protein AM2010_536 [Pelagerythrobacter marensis]
MTQLTRSADCGNSPKNKAVEDLAIALEGGPWCGDLLDENTVWDPPAGDRVTGARAIEAAIADRSQAIRIDRVATHGKSGAASGSADGRRFAHVITFTSASAKNVAAIDSFRKNETSYG